MEVDLKEHQLHGDLTRLLVYFLYGIHHSKEQEVTSSYKVLLTSNEAVKLRWGAIPPRRRTKSPDDDTRPIVDSD
ncbi:hypothetical protein M8J75_004364 [Diaphorina citri]|nr:hypothetical protein M8J75_004364 [Diaphorina citri]